VENDVLRNKKLAQNTNLKMSGERCIKKKKVAQNPKLKMISGERCIKKTSSKP
jgi:hypothetical protein